MAPGALPGGERTGLAAGSGVEPFDWRGYLPGDDARLIDWRAYARLDRPFVRLRSSEEASPVYVLVDASGSMAFPRARRRRAKFDFARSIAAALGAAALFGTDVLRAGFLKGGAARPEEKSEQPGEPARTGTGGLAELGPALTGERSLGELFDLLARGGAGGRMELAAALSNFLELAGYSARAPGRALPAGFMVVVSDFWCGEGDEPLGGLERVLRQAAEAGLRGALVQVLSPEELRPPPAARARLVDLEGGAELRLLLSREAVELYREELERHLARLKESAARYGFLYALLSTDRDLSRALLEDLRKAGVVG